MHFRHLSVNCKNSLHGDFMLRASHEPKVSDECNFNHDSKVFLVSSLALLKGNELDVLGSLLLGNHEPLDVSQ